MIFIKFNIRNFVDTRSQGIMVRVRWNNKKFEVGFSTGLYAQIDKWDPLLQRAKRGTTHSVRGMKFLAADINTRLAEFNDAIRESFENFSVCNSVPTTIELKQMVNSILGRGFDCSTSSVPKKKTLKELLDDFLEKEGLARNWDYKCKAKYIQAYNHLTAAIPSISPDNISLESLYILRKWYADNNYVNETVIKQTRILKCFLKWINKKDEYNIPDEVFDYKPNLKVIKKTVTYLKFDELMAFAEFKLDSTRLAKARDLWCFMAFTSLRYSDLSQLRPAHIVDGSRIDMVTQKTYDHITVPLIDAAKDILKKYEGKTTKDGFVFDVPSNQKLNDYIKEAAVVANLDREIIYDYYIGTERRQETHKFYEIISCHDARRTFVSCSLAMGIPAPVVMKATGHKDYETMKPYIETANETQALEMEKWNRTKYKSKIIEIIDKASEEQLKKILLDIQTYLLDPNKN